MLHLTCYRCPIRFRFLINFCNISLPIGPISWLICHAPTYAVDTRVNIQDYEKLTRGMYVSEKYNYLQYVAYV